MITTKRCSHCKQIKSVNEFGKDRSREDGLSVYCRVCHRASNKKYYNEHREICIERRKEYYKKHKKEIRERKKEYAKKYCEMHRDEMHHEEFLKQFREYQEKLKDNRQERLNALLQLYSEYCESCAFDNSEPETFSAG